MSAPHAEPTAPDPDDAASGRPIPARRVLRGVGRAGELLLRWVLRLGLPLAGVLAVLHAFPYRATVQGIPFTVEGGLFRTRGLSAETTLGSWVFPDVDGLPLGVHVTPRDVNLLTLTAAAGDDRAAFVQRLRADFVDQVPRIAAWLVGEVLLGVLLGLGAAAAVNMSVRYLRGRPRRPDELRHRALQFSAAVLVVLAVAVYGVVTYNRDWVRSSRLTGTLAAAQLFPSQLSQYYQQQSKAFDVLGSVLGIQAALQSQIDADRTPATALQIMFISDMHLAGNYPLVASYAENYGVDLIIDTGDESEFGTGIELTPGFLDAVRAVAARTPMLWLAGNHDSPAVETTMRAIPGVTVLGSKTATADGFAVRAGSVNAFGLTVAGLPDPRVYGGPSAYGADDTSVTDPLERQAVDGALAGLTGDGKGDGDGNGDGDPAEAHPGAPSFDVFATHEPVAADELRERLPGAIRQTVAGHLHRQNDPDDIQDGDGAIDLVEGSTGAGGLDNIVRGENRPPIEFSIESVAPDCQFTRVVRFQIDAAQPTSAHEPASPQAYGDDVTASTIYFRPQDVAAGRTCDASLGITPERPW